MTQLPQNILLDLDGTLLDSLPGLEFSIVEAFRSEGMHVPLDRLAAVVGPPVRQMMSQLRPGLEEAQLDRLEAAFRRSYDGEGWQKTTCFPGARAVLQAAMRSGRRLFVVSNKPRHIALRILEAEQVLNLFEEIVTRDSREPAYRDKSEIIRTLQERRQLNPADTVMVGDTMEDAEAASNSGVAFILMSHGYGAAGFEPKSPGYVCANFEQWLPMLAGERVA